MLITLSTKQATPSAILLPLCPASLTHNYASRGMQRSVDRTEDVFVEYPVCVISVAVLVTVV